MQYFASFQEFEVFEEFNGVKGTFIKSFLISDKVNLNDWQATHEANISNLQDAIGRPGIHYINPETKKLDHTGATTKEKSLQIQELYRAASIIAVGSDIQTKRMWQFSKMIDDGVANKIKSGDIRFISPSIWPKDNAVELLPKTDGGQISVVHDYFWLHYAFVDEPAYGDEASIKSFCDGTTKECQLEMQNFTASINEVGPITDDKKIIIPPKEKEKNSSKSKVNTSHKINSTSQTQMATEQELQKELEETKKSLKATEEELEKQKEKEAKKATEDEEKEKDVEGKKAQEDDDEEKKALKARIESLEKVPIVDKIVSTQVSAGVITKDKVSDLTIQLMQTPLTQLSAVLATSKSFEAKLNSIVPQTQSTIAYMGSNYSDESFDASTMSDEELLLEVGV